jgi:hypothetical protein
LVKVYGKVFVAHRKNSILKLALVVARNWELKQDDSLSTVSLSTFGAPTRYCQPDQMLYFMAVALHVYDNEDFMTRAVMDAATVTCSGSSIISAEELCNSGNSVCN